MTYSLEEDRDAKWEERHQATMYILRETFSGRSRHTSPAQIANNEQVTENNHVDSETAPITQRIFSGPRAKARRRSWDDFAELEQLGRFPATQLRTHLTVEMRAVLPMAIGIDTDSASSVTEVLDAIRDEYVHGKRNVPLDGRVALEERRQEEGQTFDEYCIALRDRQQHRSVQGLHRRSLGYMHHVRHS